MNSLEQRVENQVQFWALLGPFIFLMSVGVLIFKLSSHWYFPLSIVIGIPLCFKWKIKGMAIALTFLFAVSLIAYPNLNLDERYWHVGMALAMAFSFIILTLSLEEVEGVLTKLQIESKSRLENFLRLDDTTKKAAEAWIGEKAALDYQIVTLMNDLTIALKDKEVFYKLAQLAKDELLQMRTQQDLLQQDLNYKKHQIFQLNEKLEETEITLQGMIDADPEKEKAVELALLTESLENLKKEYEKVSISENHALQSVKNYELQILELAKEVQASRQVEMDYKVQLETCEQTFKQITEEKNILNDQNHHLRMGEEKSLQDKAVLIQEREQLFESKRKLEAHLEQVQIEKLLLLEALELSKKEYEKVSISENQALQSVKNYELQILELAKEVQASRQVEMDYKVQLETCEQTFKQITEEKSILNDQNHHLRMEEAKHIQDKAELTHEREQLFESKRNLEAHLEEAQIEKSLLLEALEISKNDYFKIADSQEKLTRKVSEIQAQLIQSELEIISLNKMKNELESQLVQLNKSHAEVIHEVQSQRDKFEHDYFLQNETLASVQEELVMAKNQLTQLDEDKKNQENLIQRVNLENIQNVQLKFERLLQEKEIQLSEIQEKMKKLEEHPPENTSLEISHRGFECLYLQLKQQFQEKSEVLDQTRQELFMALERVLVLQKTLEEQEVFSLSESEGMLQTTYQNLIQEFEMLQSEYDQELEQLQAIITHQMSEIAHISHK